MGCQLAFFSSHICQIYVWAMISNSVGLYTHMNLYADKRLQCGIRKKKLLKWKPYNLARLFLKFNLLQIYSSMLSNNTFFKATYNFRFSSFASFLFHQKHLISRGVYYTKHNFQSNWWNCQQGKREKKEFSSFLLHESWHEF